MQRDSDDKAVKQRAASRLLSSHRRAAQQQHPTTAASATTTSIDVFARVLTGVYTLGVSEAVRAIDQDAGKAFNRVAQVTNPVVFVAAAAEVAADAAKGHKAGDVSRVGPKLKCTRSNCGHIFRSSVLNITFSGLGYALGQVCPECYCSKVEL